MCFRRTESGRDSDGASAVWWEFLAVVAGWLVILGCFACFLTPFWAGCWFWLPLVFFKLGGLLPPAHPRRPASGTGAHPHPVRAVAVGVGAVARDLRRPQCGPPRGRQPHLSLSTYKMGARGGERGSWQVVEKQRKKDLGKVVTGGGEDAEKANHGGHGGHGEGKPQRTRRKTNHGGHGAHSAAEPQPNRCGGIKNLRARKRIYGLVVQRTRRGEEKGRLEVERAVLRATPPVLAAVGVSNSPTAAERVALPA